jgi:hypothetical protein
MEQTPWSTSVSAALQRGHLLAVRLDVVGADASEEMLERSHGISGYPSVLLFSRFLYHLCLVYEVSRLATDPQYRRFRFPRVQFHPTVSRLDPIDRMVLLRISQNSPWQLSASFVHDAATMSVGALGGLWLLVQCLDKLSTISLNRRKLRAEIEKIELESAKLQNEMSASTFSMRRITDASGHPDIQLSQRTTAKRRSNAGAPSDDFILPPAESSHLYKLLRRRGARKFYDENTQAAGKLGFKIEEISVTIENDV